MSKPLAGKRWFYALGQRSMHGIGPWPSDAWPKWARHAFFKGQDDERWSRARTTVKTWPISKLVEAA